MSLEKTSQKITPYHWLVFSICFIGTLFGGTISTLMSVYLPAAVKDLLGTTAEEELNRISAYINAVFILGGAIGGITAGILSDRLGRKPAVILSIFCCASFTLLTAFMPDWWQVVLCRFMSGLGLGAVLVTTNVMLLETWPSRSRAIFLGFLSIAIPVGIFSAGVIDFFVSSWRQAFLVGIIPLLIAIAAGFLLKESQSWKTSVIAGHAKAGAPPSPFHLKSRRNLLIGSIIFGTMLIGLWAIFSWLPTWITTLVSTGDGREERGLSMMMLGAGGLAGGFASGWLTNAIGARRSMILCFLICSVMSFILFKTNFQFSAIIYVEIVILAVFFGISQGVLSVFIPALFPVGIRGTATGFCFNAGRILTAIAVLFVGVLVSELGGYANALFIFSGVFIAGLLVTIFSREETASTLSNEQLSYDPT